MIPVARPSVGRAEMEAVQRPLTSGWLTQGPEVAAFEREFASFVGAPYACAVSNCTTALHLALRAVGVGPGDEVITVSHSFIATANAIRYCDALPVFVDVQPDTYNIDPQKIRLAVSSRTKAILVVHQLGMTRLQTIHIGEYAWLGESSVVLANVGASAMVVAGAVVSAAVPPSVVVAGNPARFVRCLTPPVEHEHGTATAATMS